MIEAVAGSLGCFKETAKGEIAVNVGLASALFITALSGRFFGVGPTPPEDFISPRMRLARLIEALGPTPGRFDLSDEAAWELVDNAARDLWGRTALEEIANDIDAMEAARGLLFQPWLTEEKLPDVWEDFVALRRRLLRAVEQQGPASLSPRAFPTLWLDRLLPWHVVGTPGGEAQTDDDGVVVFSRRFNIPSPLDKVPSSLVVWGRLHEAPSHLAESGFAPRNRAAWIEMLECHGPRARLMLNGRRHRLMVPPELERPIEELSNIGARVCFEPQYEWPEDRSPLVRAAEARSLAEWSERTSFVCDITGEQIAVADAAVLTPWEFRRSPLLQRFRDNCEAEIMAELLLASNWSDWIVRANLLPN
jgi:hypothetical protein